MAIREVIFRGKRTDNGKWECGDLLSPNEFNAIPHIVYIDYLNEYGDIGEISTPVIPETVGQYTGLTDKNDVRIFEGDIVSLVKHNGLIYKVVYEPCRFELVNSKDINCFVLDIYKSEDIEVIGNIHDKPELLKGGEGE